MDLVFASNEGEIGHVLCMAKDLAVEGQRSRWGLKHTWMKMMLEDFLRVGLK